jgi:leucyl aminopeptidase (aminopeptidase T)
MLEDEKAFTTCHFAIGENYDNDAPSLIHLDGVVRNPTIDLYYEDGSVKKIMEKGQLLV